MSKLNRILTCLELQEKLEGKDFDKEGADMIRHLLSCTTDGFTFQNLVYVKTADHPSLEGIHPMNKPQFYYAKPALKELLNYKGKK